MHVERLKKRREFLAVAASGQKAVARGLVLQYMRNPSLDAETLRVGFTVTKKVGNAVVRNRVRRRLREAFRLHGLASARAGHDYVVIGRAAALDCPFERLVEDVKYALRKAVQEKSV